MMNGETAVLRARALVGTRFRPQGRSEAGLDCIGLAAAACGIADVPGGYGLRGGSIEQLEAGLKAAGFRKRRELCAGDLLIVRSGPEQLHLGIWTGTGLVHADAGLRRVVERPGGLAWPLLGIWRAPQTRRR